MSFASPPPTKSSSLSLHMPQHVADNANLATQVIPTDAPPWAIAYDAAHPQSNGHFEVMGSRTYHSIFHLPNLGGVIRKWLFTRPTIEAISEDSFSNSAVESMTLFRIERIDDMLRSLMVTPTVSSHYMFIPCQTINGYTVGLAYLDTTYERDNRDDGMRDNRVPPLRLGRFVIDDSTGEIFCSAWIDNLMVVAWTQSIIKCERVHEYLLFDAPPDGTPPRNLLLRNSFFERRSCALCGHGNSIVNLPPPCSGVDNRRLSQDPANQMPNMLTNVASIYRRFRGSYFGVVLKTRYGADRQPLSQQLVPVFAELKHGLHTVKMGFKNNLRKNIELVLGAASNDGYFGVNPRSATKSSLLLLKACNPVVSDYNEAVEKAPEDPAEIGESRQARKRRRSTSPLSVVREGSILSTEGDAQSSYSYENNESVGSYEGQSAQNQQGSGNSPGTSGAGPARRKRSEDPLKRDSIMHKRKVRNRISAQKSNQLRKMMLDQKKAELAELKLRLPRMQQYYQDLQRQNQELKLKVLNANFNSNPNNSNISSNINSNSNSNSNNNMNNNMNNMNLNLNLNLNSDRSADLEQQYVGNNGSFDGAGNSFGSGKLDFSMDGVDANQIQMDWMGELKSEGGVVVGTINNQSFG